MDEEKFRRFIYTNLTKGPSIAAEAGEGSASSERGEKKGKKEEKGGKKSLTIASLFPQLQANPAKCLSGMAILRDVPRNSAEKLAR